MPRVSMEEWASLTSRCLVNSIAVTLGLMITCEARDSVDP